MEDLFEHYDTTQVMGPSISNDVYSVIDEVYNEGLAYSEASDHDCHLLIVNKHKAIDTPIRNRLAERLSPDPNCNMTRVMLVLGTELYDYLRMNAAAEGVVEMNGDLYLACIPADRIRTKNFIPILS